MPEWPEIEYYRKQLAPLLSGHRIIGVDAHRAEALNEPAETFILALTGRTVLFVEHRGQYILLHLDDGSRLLIQCGPGVRFVYASANEERNGQSAIATVSLSDGGRLRIEGSRQVGLQRLSAKASSELMKKQGPDPLDSRLKLDLFRKRLAGRKGRLKATLTDHRFLAGIGNVYGDEICYDARLHPATPIGTLDNDAITRLYASLRKVLTEASEAGGYIPDAIEAGDAQSGGYKNRLQVYGREGQTGDSCAEPIKYETIAGRKMYYCPAVQKLDEL